MQPVAKYFKDPTERKRYKLDYSQWLDTGEQLSNVIVTIKTPNTVSPLVVDGIGVFPSLLGVQYYISGGKSGTVYELLVQATTSGGQIKEDAIFVIVKDN